MGASGSEVTAKENAMSNIYSPAQIDQFKRDAKRLARDESLPHSAALDKIAVESGYLNWPLLLKRASSYQAGKVLRPSKKSPYLLLRTADEMRQAMRKTGQDLGRDYPLRAQIKDLSGLFASAENALDFAISYMECALAVERFSVHSLSFAYYEMRCWLPYCCHIVAGDTCILLGRDYKPVGMVQKQLRVNYADFQQVHIHVKEHELRQHVSIYRKDRVVGYLYDGSPWTSRRDALTYVNHLKKLRNWLSSRVSQINLY